MKFLLASALTVIATSAPSELTFKDAVVVRADPAPFHCGVLKTWGAVSFSQSGRIQRAYVLCALAEDLPRLGARCSATLRQTEIEDVTPDFQHTPATPYIVESMTCDPPIKA